MATLKDVQTKIGAVKKTKQITKAMNMVATSRLRGAQMAMDGFRPYAGKFAEVLGSLAEKAGEEASPLLIPCDEVKKIQGRSKAKNGPWKNDFSEMSGCPR